MDKGFIDSIKNHWKKTLSKFSMFSLLISIFSLGCVHPHSVPVGPFECVYKNASTEHYYFGKDEKRDAAMFTALQECQTGPVPWNCTFRYCNEVESAEVME